MPAAYAHYRFGFRTLSHLSPDVQSCIRRHRQMYDLGLHGPDFLFFYNPLTKDKFYQAANQIHRMTGRDFFSRAARQLRLTPSESATSYLYGVLAHFALDSHCHPYIQQQEDDGIVSHMALEAELDRFLLDLDGKPKPHEVCLTRHIRLNKAKQADEIARFYPEITGKQIIRSMKHFRFLMDFCTVPDGLRRKLIEKGVFTGIANEATMMTKPNPLCVNIMPELKKRYDKAEHAFPKLMDQLSAHLSYGRAFDSEFDLIFG